MKKFVVLCFLTLAAAASSSADTITVACPTSGGSGPSGTSTSTCNAAPLVGFSSLDSVVLTFKFDADFGLGPGSVLESFDVDPSGSGDAFGGAFDHPTPQMVTDLVRGIVGTFTILNPTLTEVDAALSGLSIQGIWSGGTGSFNNAAFDYQIDVNYTPGTGNGDGGGSTTAPEPPTLELICGALVGLCLLARSKPQLRISRS